ncbi:DUF1642 domain-containing protein [Enterococcus faecium]|nr:DUF1642 domain-containing protein [Enterococcus faecium]NTJ83839.1 DUF1642 domain-containing protein [Enterococcus faecium]NTQ62867.1 DUF1642 domain-containing protein [Enterococcus faecium]
MNKQELIDELAKYVKSYENAMDEHGQGRYGAYEVSLKLVKRLNESKITDEQAWNKVAEAYPESAQSLRNTLDNAVFGKTGEHQKPVVPKFVAEWIEYAKKKGDSLAISFKPWNLYGVEYSKVDRWIEDNQETFARAWIDGYEVEKEPLYRVKIGEGYFVEYQGRGALIMPDCNKEIKIFDSKSDAERTAQTIGGAVEEVAEG